MGLIFKAGHKNREVGFEALSIKIKLSLFSVIKEQSIMLIACFFKHSNSMLLQNLKFPLHKSIIKRNKELTGQLSSISEF